MDEERSASLPFIQDKQWVKQGRKKYVEHRNRGARLQEKLSNERALKEKINRVPLVEKCDGYTRTTFKKKKN